MSMTNDVEAPTIKGAAADYWARVKAGDIGSLPAVLGLIVLCLVFGSMSSVFLTPGNFANLITQAAAVIVIAMGLVFVLLLGEIDLSAGYTAGVTGAVLVILITNEGQPWYVALIASIAVGALLGFILGSLVARLGIPSLMYTTLLHPDYHTPQDNVENINFPKLKKMADWMYRTGWKVANTKQRPATDKNFKLER